MDALWEVELVLEAVRVNERLTEGVTVKVEPLDALVTPGQVDAIDRTGCQVGTQAYVAGKRLFRAIPGKTLVALTRGHVESETVVNG